MKGLHTARAQVHARPAPAGNALVVEKLGVSLGDRTVLQGLSFALPVGRWISVVGPNGAGKSSLLKALAGLLPWTGSVQLMGRSWADWSSPERARTLAWLGQAEPGHDDLQVLDLVLLGRLPHQPWWSGPGAADREAARQALHSVDAWSLWARRFGELSGGERQRVLLARALAVQAQVVLMDEPLAHLDPPHQADWLALVRQLSAQGCTVVSVLHELNMALAADELLLLRAGCLVHAGSCADAQTHRALEAVFDHRVAVHALHRQWVVQPVVEPAVQPGPLG